MDFNTLNNAEGDYKEQPFLDSIVDLFFSEVELLLTTEPNDILGNNDFGLNTTDIIWKMNATEGKVIDGIRRGIEMYCLTSTLLKKYDINVKFSQGSDRDIALITIIAEPFDGETISKSFLFK